MAIFLSEGADALCINNTHRAIRNAALKDAEEPEDGVQMQMCSGEGCARSSEDTGVYLRVNTMNIQDDFSGISLVRLWRFYCFLHQIETFPGHCRSSAPEFKS